MMILKMSSGIRAGIRSSYGRSPSWFEPIYPYIIVLSGALSGGRGSGKREAGEDRGGLIELGRIPVKLLGERLRKEGSCRGLDIRAAKFVSRLSEFQASEFQSKDQMVQWIEDRRGARGRERAEG
jgi:hypothetical protein